MRPFRAASWTCGLPPWRGGQGAFFVGSSAGAPLIPQSATPPFRPPPAPLSGCRPAMLPSWPQGQGVFAPPFSEKGVSLNGAESRAGSASSGHFRVCIRTGSAAAERSGDMVSL